MAATLHCQNFLSNINIDCLLGAGQHGCSTVSRHLVHAIPILWQSLLGSIIIATALVKQSCQSTSSLCLGRWKPSVLQGIGMLPCQALHHTASV